MRPPLTSLLLGAVALSGCPENTTPATNPKVLWLAPANMRETNVKLIDAQPPPY
jgi:hypothetical protein